jgi:hypothetical protein
MTIYVLQIGPSPKTRKRDGANMAQMLMRMISW